MNLDKLRLIGGLGGVTVLLAAGPAHAGIVPTPEPGTFVLLGAGAAAVGAVAWWRRRK